MMKTAEIMRDRLKNSKGFTLIEVIAVLVILTIVSAVILSRGSSTGDYDVKSRAEAIKSHIRYAQSQAMATGSILGIYIQDSKHYYLFKGTTATMVSLPGADSNPVFLGTSGPSLSTGTISFDAMGAPSGVASVTVSMSGVPSELITITQNTGYIR